MKEKSNKEDYRTAKDVLQEFVQANRLQAGLDNVNIEKIWRSEMGAPIAKYTSHIVLKRTTLFVELSSAPLRNELNYAKEKIIRRLNQAMNREVIKKIVLR